MEKFIFIWNYVCSGWIFLWSNLQNFAALSTILGILIAFVTYMSDRKARKDKDRPWIFIDIDISTFSICNLELKNIGGSPAKDIKTSFVPDVEITEGRTVNNIGIIKKLPFLSPARDISFFFGTFTETRILQPFQVTITYKDIYGKKYTEKQVVDPSAYLGMIRANKKGISDIADSLKKMEKPLDTLSKVSERQLDSWKKGLLIRNMKFSTMSVSEKIKLLAAIYNNGQKDETWLNPFVYDLQLLFKEVRDEIAAKKNKTDVDNKQIELLNDLFAHMFDLGPNTEFYDKYKQFVEVSNEVTVTKEHETKSEG